MKAIGIVGFKKSGKTTLTVSIARVLMERGYQVAVIKHSVESISHGNTDSGQFMKEIPQVAIIAPENSEIILKDGHQLKDIISYLSADFLIVEGFKQEKYFPKIVCLRQEEEKKVLDDGLVLFTAGLDASLKKNKAVDFLITVEEDVAKMVTEIEKRGFFLPEMNCGDCGYENCYGFAKAIVTGTASEEKCVFSNSHLTIKVNKKRVYLNSFMSKLYQNMILGMFSSLKGIHSLENAHIEIKLNSEETLDVKKDN